MTHTGLESIEIAFRDVRETTVVTRTDDHELKDYVPFIKIEKWSPFKPSDMKVLQAEKGMIIIGAGCEDCECSVDDLTYSEGKKEGKVTVHKIYVTPIDSAYEHARLTEWVRELKKRLYQAEEAHH